MRVTNFWKFIFVCFCFVLFPSGTDCIIISLYSSGQWSWVPVMSSIENESDIDYSETEECGYDDYYNLCDDADNESVNQKKCDPEHFDFECLTVDQVRCSNVLWLFKYSNISFTREQVERLLNELVETLSSRLRLTPSLSKLLLHTHKWQLDSVIKMYLEDSSQLLVCSKLKPDKTPTVKTLSKSVLCPICIISLPRDLFRGIGCSHLFCKGCWNTYLETQVLTGVSTGKHFKYRPSFGNF